MHENAICRQSEESSSDDSFCLQLKVEYTQTSLKIPTPSHLIANLAYRLKPHHARNQYPRARLDTCTEVNIMPTSVYRLVFKDPELKKLAPSTMEIGTYTTDTVKIMGFCVFYLVHLDTKKICEVTIFAPGNDGSVLLLCTTTLVFGLIQPRTRLEYLPPMVSLITSSVDYPKKTKCQATVHSSRKDCTVSPQKNVVPKLVTSKQQILHNYPDVFDGIGRLPGPPYHIQLDSSIAPKQTPCQPIPVHLKEAFKQEVDKMLQVGVLKPVHEATPWINNFVLVEGKDNSGNLKVRICLDPTNLNKSIVREPYHFKTPKDIGHLLMDACIMTVCDCMKGYWYQQLDEASSCLTTFNTELGRFRYIVMPFGVTEAGDVFQCELDQCFGNIKPVIVIADDIMIVGKKQNHSDHDQVLMTLLETARKCNVKLNYDKVQ